MSRKEVNDNVGPDGMVMMLLGFGAHPRLGFTHDRVHPSTAVRSLSVNKAKEAVPKIFSCRQVQDALNQKWASR